MDAEGAVWTGTAGCSVVRVAAGGTILQRVEMAENRAPLALMLGGPDRRTLFICTGHLHGRMAAGRRARRQPRPAGHRAAHG